jgi:galactokinase
MHHHDLLDLLTRNGLSPAAAEQKAGLFAKAFGTLGDAAGVQTLAWFVPGRIEVLGKHTDYAGGSSMVVAAERGFCIAMRPRNDDQVRVIDALRKETIEFRMNPDLAPPVGHWSNYPMTVARRIARNFSARLGAEISLASDLPPAAGMSSSSALIIGIFLALAEANHLASHPAMAALQAEPLDLAGYLGTIENGQSFGVLEGDRGVGTFGGSEDHTAILCGRPNTIMQFAYCPVRFERALPMPPGNTFVIAASGVVSEKTGEAREKYNRASRLAAEAAGLWRQRTGRSDPHLAAVVRSDPGAAERLRDLLTDPELAARARQFLLENEEVIPAAGRALESGDIAEFGRQVDRSQWGTEHLLGNQVPETIELAAAARRLGAAAASAFGAGFGGGVWALAGSSEADGFLHAWREAYLQRFPQHVGAAQFFVTAAGPAAFRVA